MIRILKCKWYNLAIVIPRKKAKVSQEYLLFFTWSTNSPLLKSIYIGYILLDVSYVDIDNLKTS